MQNFQVNLIVNKSRSSTSVIQKASFFGNHLSTFTHVISGILKITCRSS